MNPATHTISPTHARQGAAAAANKRPNVSPTHSGMMCAAGLPGKEAAVEAGFDGGKIPEGSVCLCAPNGGVGLIVWFLAAETQ